MKIEMTERQYFHEQMLIAVREEMQEQGMRLVGALLAGINTVNVEKALEKPIPEEVGLPEACGDFRTNSAAYLILSVRYIVKIGEVEDMYICRCNDYGIA